MSEPSETSEAGASKKARAAVVRAEDRATEALQTVRGSVGNLQATVADALDAKAEAFRKREGVALETERATTGPRVRGQVAELPQTVARSLEHTAMWLRENDVTDVGGLLGQELRERPGRTALIALCLGFVLGRASRR